MFFQEFSLVLLIKTNSSIFSFCFTFLMKLGEIVTFHCVEGVSLCRNIPIQPVCAPWLWWKSWIWYESHFFPGHAGSSLLSRRWSGNGGARAAACHEPGEVLAQDTTPPCWRSGHVSGCWSSSPEGQVWIGSFSNKCTSVPKWALGGPGPSPGHSQHAVSMRANNGCLFPVPMLLGVQPHLAQLSLFLRQCSWPRVGLPHKASRAALGAWLRLMQMLGWLQETGQTLVHFRSAFSAYLFRSRLACLHSLGVESGFLTTLLVVPLVF